MERGPRSVRPRFWLSVGPQTPDTEDSNVMDERLARTIAAVREIDADWVVLSAPDSVAYALGYAPPLDCGPSPFAVGPNLAVVGRDDRRVCSRSPESQGRPVKDLSSVTTATGLFRDPIHSISNGSSSFSGVSASAAAWRPSQARFRR